MWDRNLTNSQITESTDESNHRQKKQKEKKANPWRQIHTNQSIQRRAHCNKSSTLHIPNRDFRGKSRTLTSDPLKNPSQKQPQLNQKNPNRENGVVYGEGENGNGPKGEGTLRNPEEEEEN